MDGVYYWAVVRVPVLDMGLVFDVFVTSTRKSDLTRKANLCALICLASRAGAQTITYRGVL